MTCRSVRKLLPLAAGGDLSEGKAGRVAAHIKTCAACRAELDAYLSALDRVRELDGAAGHSWNDTAWAKVVRRAVAQGSEPAAARPKPALRPAVIAVTGAVLIAVAALLLVLTRHPLRPREVLEAR
ncbi:MAG: zf-HC2 domain-containing protein, partial [Candidatus Aminicenantes bacterium]|nr:zf-HC2 domain-containing protein [Candidatus Aminicenantes bacterium]